MTFPAREAVKCHQRGGRVGVHIWPSSVTKKDRGLIPACGMQIWSQLLQGVRCGLGYGVPGVENADPHVSCQSWGSVILSEDGPGQSSCPLPAVALSIISFPSAVVTITWKLS